jgi:hypothetical protein
MYESFKVVFGIPKQPKTVGGSKKQYGRFEILKLRISSYLIENFLKFYVKNFLIADPEVPGSILGATRCSDK